MTLDEFFAAGTYADFVLIAGEVYVIPLGYALARSSQAKTNTVTAANGHKREDIIREWERFTFSYETVLDSTLAEIKTLVEASKRTEEIRLFLKREDRNGYDSFDIDIIKRVNSKYQSRAAFFVHGGVSLEME